MTLRATLELQENRADKRSAARRTLRLRARGGPASGPASEVVVHDLSSGGMLIESAESLAIGETLAVELPRSGAHMAVVVWSSTRFYGCRFVEPLPSAAMSAALLKAFPAARVEPQQPLPPEVHVAERLAVLRRARGLTIAQLASRLSVSRQSVWYWETGKRQPKPAMLSRLAEQLRVNEGELLRARSADEEASDDLALWRARIADRFGVSPGKVRILIEL